MAKDNRGAQFDILDKAVAARFWELYNRPNGIYRQDVDTWRTDYNQLEAYARANSDVPYVARQWRDEEPRYSRAVEFLLTKVRAANPSNYDTTIRIHSGGSCGGTKIPQLNYTPMQIPGSNYAPVAGRPPTILSLGDGVRNNFSGGTLPFFDSPSGFSKEIAKDSMTGIIVAIVVGAIFWIVHSLSKKRAN